MLWSLIRFTAISKSCFSDDCDKSVYTFTSRVNDLPEVPWMSATTFEQQGDELGGNILNNPECVKDQDITDDKSLKFFEKITNFCKVGIFKHTLCCDVSLFDKR